MRTRFLTLTLGLLVLLCASLSARADVWRFSPYMAQVASGDVSQAPADETMPMADNGKKNIGKGVMFSLIIPGTGQLYAGSWLRALPWVAIEVAGWAMFSTYHGDGNTKTDEFEAFAGTSDNPNNFSFDAYMLREYQVASNPATSESGTAYAGNLSDWKIETWDTRDTYLPPPYGHDITTNDIQQYFEMVGKYFQQFGFGWIDTYDFATHGHHPDQNAGHIWTSDTLSTLPYDGQSPLFFQYRDMRGEANSLLEKGNTMMEIVLVNHVLSALDAAFAIRNHNRKISDGDMGGLKMEYDIKRSVEGNLTRFVKLSMPLKFR